MTIQTIAAIPAGVSVRVIKRTHKIDGSSVREEHVVVGPALIYESAWLEHSVEYREEPECPHA